MPEMTCREALNQALHEEMERDRPFSFLARTSVCTKDPSR